MAFTDIASDVPFGNDAPVPTYGNPRNGSRRAGNGVPQDKGPPAQYWGNACADLNGESVQMPGVGYPLDTTQPLPLTGQNQDYLRRAAKQNALLAVIQRFCEGMQPGEVRKLPIPFFLEVRRVSDRMDVSDSSLGAYDAFMAMLSPQGESKSE